MAELTELTRERLRTAFRPSDHAAATTVLEQMAGEHDTLLERCRLAALKISQGELGELRTAAALHRLDFRDLLVNAGFADDTNAHLKWTPSPRG